MPQGLQAQTKATDTPFNRPTLYQAL